MGVFLIGLTFVGGLKVLRYWPPLIFKRASRLIEWRQRKLERATSAEPIGAIRLRLLAPYLLRVTASPGIFSG